MNKPLKDHLVIGQQQELFFINEIAPGGVFWLPKGMLLLKELEKYIRKLTEEAGYFETSTPMAVKSDLFRQSGHYEKFGAHKMVNLSLYEDAEIDEIRNKIKEEDGKIKKLISGSGDSLFGYPITLNNGQKVEPLIIVNDKTKRVFTYTLPFNYSLKPMNCPESTVIYSFRTRSYKELPLRLSEIGRLFRREKSGEVSGLFRVRQLIMDDAHIYAREDQVKNEISIILDTMKIFYKNLGFDFDFRLATRPDENFAGTKEDWEKGEKILEDVLKIKKIKYTYKKGEGAFYGPKIDLHIQAINKDWQLATVQLDLYEPQAFDLKYVDQRGKFQKPAMIHRAIFGSFERFIAILTEHFQGTFPLWLSPIQVTIVPISEKHLSYSRKVLQELRENEVRAELDERNETMQSKLRDATLQKVPYMIIIGDKEIKDSQVSVRTREGKDLGELKASLFLQTLKKEIDKKV